MARSGRERQTPKPRLYVAAPMAVEPALIGTAIAAADVAAVLLQGLDGFGEPDIMKRAKKVAAAVQPGGAALLLPGHAGLVRRSGADGAHLFGLDALREALPTLRPDLIAGAGGLASRHDAMVAGELGADYILFGEPFARERPAFAAVLERVGWWSEVFEVPCVGWAESLDEAAALAAAGADFVAVGEFIWNDARGPAAALAAVAAWLDDVEVVK